MVARIVTSGRIQGNRGKYSFFITATSTVASRRAVRPRGSLPRLMRNELHTEQLGNVSLLVAKRGEVRGQPRSAGPSEACLGAVPTGIGRP